MRLALPAHGRAGVGAVSQRRVTSRSSAAARRSGSSTADGHGTALAHLPLARHVGFDVARALLRDASHRGSTVTRRATLSRAGAAPTAAGGAACSTTCTYSGSKVRAAVIARLATGRAKDTLELTFHPRAAAAASSATAAVARSSAAAAGQSRAHRSTSRRPGSSATTCRITGGSRRTAPSSSLPRDAAAARLGDDRVPARGGRNDSVGARAPGAGTTAEDCSRSAVGGRSLRGLPLRGTAEAYRWKARRCCWDCCCDEPGPPVYAPRSKPPRADAPCSREARHRRARPSARPPRRRSMSPFCERLVDLRGDTAPCARR